MILQYVYCNLLSLSLLTFLLWKMTFIDSIYVEALISLRKGSTHQMDLIIGLQYVRHGTNCYAWIHFKPIMQI